MANTRMFRDRVVSLEQTYEQGEKHLALLQRLVAEAIPDLEFVEYSLDHEQDCFVMLYRGPDGAEKRVSWTRMMLYDAERIPAIVENAEDTMRARIVEFIRARAPRAAIAVTFRHLEEGWADTPEPRRSRPRGRRSGGGRGRRGRGGEPESEARPRRPTPGPPAAAAERAPRPAAASPAREDATAQAPRARKRRRRRRRGRGGAPQPGGGAGPGGGRTD